MSTRYYMPVALLSEYEKCNNSIWLSQWSFLHVIWELRLCLGYGNDHVKDMP